jgi:aspartate aminotransferase
MHKLLSERHNTLSVSATIKMAALSRELKAQGHQVISLSLGEPDFHTPRHIMDAGIRGIEENYHSYPPVAGYPDLKEAICAKFKRDNNLDFEPNQIVVSAGAKQSIVNIMLALLNPGDEVLIPAPFWVSYPDMVKLAQGTPKHVYAGIDQDFKITPDQLRAGLNDKTKIFLFSSPSNPTGSVYTKEELGAFVEVLKDFPDVIVISDEIYEYINFQGGHQSIAQFEEIRDRVVIINGVSKGFAMTGWRIGYISAPAWLAKACEKIQGQITSGACSIAQRAVIEAMTGDLSATVMMKESFERRRDIVKSLLEEIPGVKTNMPKGAFYIFPNVADYIGKSDGNRTIQDVDDLCMYILEDVHVALVGGGSFGNENCLRISYAASDDDLKEAIARIKTSLAKLS